MPGNSARRGAQRKPGSKKGMVVGSGGQRRRGLEGKGPTPRAEERVNHKAYKIKAKAERSAAAAPRRSSRGGKSSGSSEMVAGRNSVVEALRASIPANTLYVASRIDSDDRVREALTLAVGRGIPVMEIPRAELDRLTDGAVHQGLAIQVPPYQYAHHLDLVDPQSVGIPLVVALDGITDPRNLGAILRSVAAFGGHGVVVPERRSVGMTASAWKVSAGAAARVPVAQVTNLTRALEDFQKDGFMVVGLDAGGETDVSSIPSAGDPLVLVVGAEGKGLSRLVRETCDHVASIPISSAMESLNAGVAVGIALYALAQQREGLSSRV